MMLAPKQHDPVNRDLEIRDIYNMEDAFTSRDGYQGAYRARLNANLAFWDGLDGKADWPTDANGGHPLTELVLADYLVVDVTKPYVRAGLVPRDRARRPPGRGARDLRRRALNDDVMDTIFTQLINAGNGPVIRDGVDRASGPPRHVPLPRRTRIPTRPRRRSTTERWNREHHADQTASILELDDIQSGALHERPSPYVGTYLLLRIDDRAAGRELVRRLHGVVDTGRPIADPAHDAWITVAFTYHGLEGARRAAGLARQLRAGVPPRDGGARGATWATSARAARNTGSSHSAAADVHVAVAALSPDRARLQRRRREGTPRPAGAGRRRGDLAPGLLPAPDRANLVRLQGRHRPAGGRGQRQPPTNPKEQPLKAGRSSSAIPTRPASCRRCRRRSARPKRHLRRVPEAAHEGRGLSAIPPREGCEPGRGGAARREDGRALAERRSARALP